ncbi:MAG: hypothetical protein HOH66_15155 [Rhodospirillaceae bacterium]|nr:hypothetical protein [Rhodospirillaceae bacterium]MBT6119198.1 hypothetical protein [Rhodospirillaceae bacterium]
MRPVHPAALAALLFLLAGAPITSVARAQSVESGAVEAGAVEAGTAARLEAQASQIASDSGAEATERRARMLRRAGQLWLVAGEPRAAIRAQSAALTLAPENAGLLIDRSIAHGFAGDHWAALDDLYHALDLDPGNVEATIFRAATYRALASPDLAHDDLDRALALNPDHPDALFERGDLRAALGDRTGATADWRRLVEVAPDSAAASSARRVMASSGWRADPEMAEKRGD